MRNWIDDEDDYYAHAEPTKEAKENLLEARAHVDSGSWDAVANHAATSDGITAHFGDLTDPAVKFILESTAIVGCVAWLTSPRILGALAKVQSAIVVQKEDFLRPDTGRNGSSDRLRQRYGALHNDFMRYWFPNPLGMTSYAGDPSLKPVSCVGNHNAEKQAAMPRMHHKFMVRVNFCPKTGAIIAEKVWTGSFNFSANAARSFENAIEIDDPRIAEEYLKEFAKVAALSEPLNWKYPWVTPQYRIGT